MKFKICNRQCYKTIFNNYFWIVAEYRQTISVITLRGFRIWDHYFISRIFPYSWIVKIASFSKVFQNSRKSFVSILLAFCLHGAHKTSFACKKSNFSRTEAETRRKQCFWFLLTWFLTLNGLQRSLNFEYNKFDIFTPRSSLKRC